jgi:redox-sensing transcriptional repressor
MVCSDSSYIPSEAIGRIALYLQSLKRLSSDNINTISSNQIANLLNVSPEQFRKDLSYFGEFGKRGVGYETKTLVKELESILSVDSMWEVAIVGIGRLGGALLYYQGFSDSNIKISTAFDLSDRVVEKDGKCFEINAISDFKKVVKRKHIKICLICVPEYKAQEVADIAVDSGIKAILNFAPVVLNVPEDVHVANMDMCREIQRLIFYVNQSEVKDVKQLIPEKDV